MTTNDNPTQQTCPHCGYCPHRGRADTSTHDGETLATLMTELRNALADQETIAGDRVIGKPTEGWGWFGQDIGAHAIAASLSNFG